ncbi:hypothetical protein BC826DRAFT_955681 [Russula brevipes]|nr:hypothetical protein BC826DRAFT_955681 [Russula brevipes]
MHSTPLTLLKRLLLPRQLFRILQAPVNRFSPNGLFFFSNVEKLEKRTSVLSFLLSIFRLASIPRCPEAYRHPLLIQYSVLYPLLYPHPSH